MTAAAQPSALVEAPRLNRRQQAKAATRARVLKASRDLFAEVGYAAAGIRDIARAAGMSTGAVFASFEDKAALWRAAMKAPAPEPAVADEIALTLGRWPDATISFLAAEGGNRCANIAWQDAAGGPGRTVAFGPTNGAALRKARELAETSAEGPPW